MSRDDNCPNHPEFGVTARCVRFDRRFCDRDFETRDQAAQCLSPKAYCEFRAQCLVWAKSKAKKKSH